VLKPAWEIVVLIHVYKLLFRRMCSVSGHADASLPEIASYQNLVLSVYSGFARIEISMRDFHQRFYGLNDAQ
jgi:hypothetical protein